MLAAAAYHQPQDRRRRRQELNHAQCLLVTGVGGVTVPREPALDPQTALHRVPGGLCASARPQALPERRHVDLQQPPVDALDGAGDLAGAGLDAGLGFAGTLHQFELPGREVAERGFGGVDPLDHGIDADRHRRWQAVEQAGGAGGGPGSAAPRQLQRAVGSGACSSCRARSARG
ncbi:MAG TPA: hypothetical protein VMR43_05865 [Variovorax sp.]|nr:hypothetical protein [Variovorax sp.]